MTRGSIQHIHTGASLVTIQYMSHFISQCASIHVLVSVLEAEACHLEASLLHVGLEAYHHEIQSLYMYLAFQEILLVFEYQNRTYLLP
jgi:hypothetical protein